jgi:serine/threonine-protein kinase
MPASGEIDDIRHRAAARVGTTLKAKYRIDRLLGAGGMAVVYAATHTRNENRVALKMLHPELSVHADLRARFLREGYLANKVAHRGAVRVIDDDSADDGAVFLVMELLEGESLDERWRRERKRLDLADTLRIADHLLDVLAAAHDKGLVHRDIKPANLFITSDQMVKVLDFGIARLRDTSTAGTLTGTTMGTPGFMAPEQARGRTSLVDARTDVWAVGATMFTLLSGQQLHQAETTNERLLAAMTQHAPPLATVVPGIPAEVARVVDQALAFEKGDRWPDARAMQEAVRHAYAAVAEGAASEPTLVVKKTAVEVGADQPLEPQGTMRTEPLPDALLPKTEVLPDIRESAGAIPDATRELDLPATGSSLASGHTLKEKAPSSRRAVAVWAALGVLVSAVALLVVATTRTPPERGPTGEQSSVAGSSSEGTMPGAPDPTAPSSTSSAVPIAPVTSLVSEANPSADVSAAPPHPATSAAALPLKAAHLTPTAPLPKPLPKQATPTAAPARPPPSPPPSRGASKPDDLFRP